MKTVFHKEDYSNIVKLYRINYQITHTRIRYTLETAVHIDALSNVWVADASRLEVLVDRNRSLDEHTKV